MEYNHWAPYVGKKSALRASFCTLSNAPTSDTKNRILQSDRSLPATIGNYE